MHFTLFCAVRMQAHYGGSLNDAAVPHLVDRPQKLSLRDNNRNRLHLLLVITILELAEPNDCEAKQLEATVEIILDKVRD
jgi:hypothetical protein